MTGLLLALSFFSREEGTGQHRLNGIFTLLVTAVVCACLFILATAKLWFPHLWTRNSTHDRHRQHSHHHPASKHRKRPR